MKRGRQWLRRWSGSNSSDKQYNNTTTAMVDEATPSKPKMQALTDKVASYFVPV